MGRPENKQINKQRQTLTRKEKPKTPQILSPILKGTGMALTKKTRRAKKPTKVVANSKATQKYKQAQKKQTPGSTTNEPAKLKVKSKRLQTLQVATCSASRISHQRCSRVTAYLWLTARRASGVWPTQEADNLNTTPSSKPKPWESPRLLKHGKLCWLVGKLPS